MTLCQCRALAVASSKRIVRINLIKTKSVSGSRMQISSESAARKARGAFFTPPEVADFLAEWAVRSSEDRLLEPSCGEAVFLLSAMERLKSHGSLGVDPQQVVGMDIHHDSVNLAKKLIEGRGQADLKVADFFYVEPEKTFDVVLGNPPYVRYQSFSGEARARAKAAALAQGVRLDGLASSWAAFTVHAAAFLRNGGRMALVLPAELLSVNYAAPIRTFLLRRFANVRLVLFEKRVFPGVLEDVVLLLAEGEGPTDHFEVLQARDAFGLKALKASTQYQPKPTDLKWTTALLEPKAASAYAELVEKGVFTNLEAWGETDLGMVTGNNKFFALTEAEVSEFGIAENDLVRISPPGSRHLRGLTFSAALWKELARAGRRVYLFYPNGDELSESAWRYIESGEKRNVQQAYKCRVRRPWWRVPKISSPDLFLTYMNHDAPRLVANRAGVSHLNSVHGVSLDPRYRKLGMDLLPIAALNSATLLGAELVGRSYGGGMLKLEPKEADRLPVPSPQTLEQCAAELRALRPQLSKHLRNSNLKEAVKMVDRVLLLQGVGVKSSDIELMRVGREALFNRRASRAKEDS